MEQAIQVLKTVFGYDAFRPGQGEIIASVLRGRDNLVIMPTGGGKSLCYQIPALCLEGTTVVVSPLISLMKDQVDTLRASGIAAAFYNSATGEREARQTLAQWHAGELQLLYVSPERLQQESFLERLEQISCPLLAIDEAHCVSSWGHDFRPDYARLGELRPRLGRTPVLALTATADETTRTDILRQLRLIEPEIFITGFDRPNIRYRVEEKTDGFSQTCRFLDRFEGDSGVVYALSRKRVEQLTERLNKAGYSAAAYHAGLPTGVRNEVHEAFLRDEIRLVVATVAFGMGIDKPDIRFVVHYDIPKNIEGYYQETGRAGRDGLPSEALLLLGYQDVVTARALVDQSQDANQKRIELSKLNAMVAFAEAPTCRRQILLRYFGEDAREACGNCDVCLNPPETFDGLRVAQMALSCVYRLHQRFGMRYVISILRSEDSPRVQSLGHSSLSTWGIGKEYSVHEWSSYIRQLIHQGYLKQDLENYAILQLTPAAGEVLRGECTLRLVQPRSPAEKRKKTSKQSGSSGTVAAELNAPDRACFAQLRSVRAQLAAQKGVPPYVIFGDRTLKEMATARPTSLDELANVHGVGAKKLEAYGELFLDILRDQGTSET